MAGEQKPEEKSAVKEKICVDAEAVQEQAETYDEGQDSDDGSQDSDDGSLDSDDESQDSESEYSAVQNEYQYERQAEREINVTTRRLDISEKCFRLGYSCEIQSLSKYHGQEWAAAEHLFKSAMDFAEEVYGEDWSPCPSPSPTSICL